MQTFILIDNLFSRFDDATKTLRWQLVERLPKARMPKVVCSIPYRRKPKMFKPEWGSNTFTAQRLATWANAVALAGELSNV